MPNLPDSVALRVPAISLALQNLSRQRARALLAALGIMIGVFAVVTLGTLGTALQVAATDELGGLGNQVIVSPAAGSSDQLNSRDLQSIERAAAGRGSVIPLESTGATVRATGGQTFAQVYGTTDPKALFGSAPGVPSYHRQGALVGPDVASALDLRVGSQITVESNTYRVVAVLPDQSSITPLQPDSAVVLPPDEFVVSGYSQVVVQADSGPDATAIAEKIRETLNTRQDRVSVFSLTDVLTQIEEFFGLLNGFLLAIAGVSLVVAGVSIFNVMLMTISERRGEIGVLRAVGIHRDEVLWTLLFESTLLGAGGGGLGAVLGVATVVGIALSTELPLDAVLVPTNALIVLGGFVFGALVALVGGLYPAYRAAWEPPVESLRG
ncbi:ABC transporter permease [Haloferax namakaokahaiae]|uniref:ABC transporter permease n=1 Tax=Haloferax namakaokahaiae TaxID=1748331 RepID=A0ABD5ZDP0_9EURY